MDGDTFYSIGDLARRGGVGAVSWAGDAKQWQDSGGVAGAAAQRGSDVAVVPILPPVRPTRPNNTNQTSSHYAEALPIHPWASPSIRSKPRTTRYHAIAAQRTQVGDDPSAIFCNVKLSPAAELAPSQPAEDAADSGGSGTSCSSTTRSANRFISR